MNFCSSPALLLIVIAACGVKRDQTKIQDELQSLNLASGEITLCGSADAQFGSVDFNVACIAEVKADFNLATALLHSFEYAEAEKVFAKVLSRDPDCLLAYWGVAMSNFHPLWAPPTTDELQKGERTISLARSLGKTGKESEYLEAVAVMFDDWKTIDHPTRLRKFEEASERIYQKYPADKEAAVFYALALRAAADPEDKTFSKQTKAGEILNALFFSNPNHPGVAHYLIHAFDYPELAGLALPAARKYATIAATSAHALHMPSHIFIRLGLWDESIQSNINMISAAQCYAENSGIKGHWDEELHGIDYLVYAYLQQGRDDMAKEQLDYLSTIDEVFPVNSKDAYTFAAVPARYALERKDWKAAATMQLRPSIFPWEKFAWERSIIAFAKTLGALHLTQHDIASAALSELRANHASLLENKRTYEAKQVQIQIMASEAWMLFSEGRKGEAAQLMRKAADMEDATEKHPVTPGEVVPARELLADMLMEMNEFSLALEAYEQDLARHAGRFNALFGAGLSAQKAGENEKARQFFHKLLDNTKSSEGQRPEIAIAQAFLKKNM